MYYCKFKLMQIPFSLKKKNLTIDHIRTWHIKIGGRGTFYMKNRQALIPSIIRKKKLKPNKRVNI